MKQEASNIIKLDDVEYVRKDSVAVPAQQLDGMKYVVVRTYSAGVHAGYLESKNGKEVVLKQSRRLWYWDGAASLSQLATNGVSKPQNCKFPCEVGRIELTEAIEIIDATKKAQESIASVAIWQQ